jgi:hypothetical protein
MNQECVDTVGLLLAIAPAVFHSPRLALKGGTALNLFLPDVPLDAGVGPGKIGGTVTVIGQDVAPAPSGTTFCAW